MRQGTSPVCLLHQVSTAAQPAAASPAVELTLEDNADETSLANIGGHRRLVAQRPHPPQIENGFHLLRRTNIRISRRLVSPPSCSSTQAYCVMAKWRRSMPYHPPRHTFCISWETWMRSVSPRRGSSATFTGGCPLSRRNGSTICTCSSHFTPDPM